VLGLTFSFPTRHVAGIRYICSFPLAFKLTDDHSVSNNSWPFVFLSRDHPSPQLKNLRLAFKGWGLDCFLSSSTTFDTVMNVERKVLSTGKDCINKTERKC
jgi:hypothetical protein